MKTVRRVRFRQADITRAIRAVTSCGLTVARVEIDADGKIVIVSGEPEKKPVEMNYFAKRLADARPAP